MPLFLPYSEQVSGYLVARNLSQILLGTEVPKPYYHIESIPWAQAQWNYKQYFQFATEFSEQQTEKNSTHNIIGECLHFLQCCYPIPHPRWRGSGVYRQPRGCEGVYSSQNWCLEIHYYQGTEWGLKGPLRPPSLFVHLPSLCGYTLAPVQNEMGKGKLGLNFTLSFSLSLQGT